MNKAIIVLLLILVAVFSKGNYSMFAHAESVNLDNSVKIDEKSDVFDLSVQEETQGKEKTQFKTKSDHNNQNTEFTLKGVITSSASDSIVIDTKTIKIDSSVTGDVKIVGTASVGAYAIVRGIIKDSNYYAKRITIDQRNKKDIEENDQNQSVTPSIDPSITPTGTQSANVEENKQTNSKFDLSKIILSVQNFLNYLKDLAQKI